MIYYVVGFACGFIFTGISLFIGYRAGERHGYALRKSDEKKEYEK